jgi:hypothetical protein
MSGSGSSHNHAPRFICFHPACIVDVTGAFDPRGSPALLNCKRTVADTPPGHRAS